MDVDAVLVVGSYRLSRLAVALGGFLIFVGIVMVGLLIFVVFDVIDVGLWKSTLSNEEYQVLFVGALLAIGVLDLLAGILLRRR